MLVGRVVAGVVAVLVTAGCSGGVCSGAELEAALRDAPDGSTVSVGACRVEGRFTVARGITLRGEGPELSTLAGPGTVVVVEGSGATLEGLRIEHGSGHGVVAVGASSLTVREVEVRSARGRAAIGLDDVASVVLEDVIVAGPVTAANAIDLPEPPTESDSALYGLALVDVASARLDRVSVSGFALAGAALARSDVTWNDGAVSTNVGLGIWASGGALRVERVGVTDTLRGFRGEPTFGLAVGGGAELTTIDVTVERVEGGFGLLSDGGSAAHDGLAVAEASAGAILAQRTTSLVLRGAELHDNDFGGLVAVEAGGLRVEDSTIASTRTVVRMLSAWGSVEIGDGLQLVRPVAGTAIHRTALSGNERAGVLIDLAGGDSDRVELDSVGVDAAGSAFGCVAQNGATLDGWDSGVTRSGAAAANDAAFGGGLDVVEIVGPSDLPPSSLLDGIVGPSD